MKPLVLWLLKLIAVLATVVLALIAYDDWYSKRITLEIFPDRILIDEYWSRTTLFTLSAEDESLLLELEKLSGGESFGKAMAAAQMSVYFGADTSLLNKANVQSLTVGLSEIRKAHRSDSLRLSRSEAMSSKTRDSLSTIYEIRDSLLSRVEELLELKTSQVEDQKRLLLIVSCANRGRLQTEILEPALLRVFWKGSPLELELDLAGNVQKMQFFGAEIGIGPPRSSISELSVAEFRFISKSQKDLGDEWNKMIDALDNDNVDCQLLIQTLDGSIHSSNRFPFSKKYADIQRERRLNRLKGEN